MANEKNAAFRAVGKFGVEVSEADGYLTIRVPLDRAKAIASASGKMRLVGSTGGFTALGNENDAIRLNLVAGFYPPR
jgi:hypothetical protein